MQFHFISSERMTATTYMHNECYHLNYIISQYEVKYIITLLIAKLKTLKFQIFTK